VLRITGTMGGGSRCAGGQVSSLSWPDTGKHGSWPSLEAISALWWATAELEAGAATLSPSSTPPSVADVEALAWRLRSQVDDCASEATPTACAVGDQGSLLEPTNRRSAHERFTLLNAEIEALYDTLSREEVLKNELLHRGEVLSETLRQLIKDRQKRRLRQSQDQVASKSRGSRASKPVENSEAFDDIDVPSKPSHLEREILRYIGLHESLIKDTEADCSSPWSTIVHRFGSEAEMLRAEATRLRAAVAAAQVAAGRPAPPTGGAGRQGGGLKGALRSELELVQEFAQELLRALVPWAAWAVGIEALAGSAAAPATPDQTFTALPTRSPARADTARLREIILASLGVDESEPSARPSTARSAPRKSFENSDSSTAPLKQVRQLVPLEQPVSNSAPGS